MKVGWNRTYILHCLICQELIFRSLKLLIFTAILSSFIFAFPIATGVVFSDVNMGYQPSGLVPQASAVPIIDPLVQNIEQFLTRYAVQDPIRSRVARAIVESSRKYNVDPKLVASIVIVESRANPLAISTADAIGVMQIHLKTWGPLAEKENLNLFKVEDNVALGVRILKGYMSRHGLWQGVARYNGMTESPESQAQADEYVQKVKRIFDPSLVATPSSSDSSQ
jgi:hypothetical protein